MSVPAADDLKGVWTPDGDRRHVHAAAELLEAIDDIVGRYAPRKIAALVEIDRLLHPPVPAEETLPNTQVQP